MEKKGSKEYIYINCWSCVRRRGFFFSSFFFRLFLLPSSTNRYITASNMQRRKQRAVRFGYKQTSMSRWRKDRGKIVEMGRKPARRLLHLAGLRERERDVCLPVIILLLKVGARSLEARVSRGADTAFCFLLLFFAFIFCLFVKHFPRGTKKVQTFAPICRQISNLPKLLGGFNHKGQLHHIHMCRGAQKVWSYAR